MLAKDSNSLESQPNQGTAGRAKDLLGKFVDTVGVIVRDITSLEVNTIVVSNISGSKFNPWQSYYNIYAISEPNYFDSKNIVSELEERYVNIFLQLEREYIYTLLAKELESPSPKAQVVQGYRSRLKYIDENRLNSDGTKASQIALPSPFDQESQVENYQKIAALVTDDKFVLTLRKVSEMKAALDGGDVTSENVDTIYAQTIIQLDGDIITRYHRDLFGLKESDKDLIMKVHNDGVVSGEKQWREVIDFLINFIKGIAS